MTNYLLFLGLLLPSPATARWAEPADAPFAVNFENTKVKVKNDGTFELEMERQIEILKEVARTEQGLQRVTFEDTSVFTLLEAKTINGRRSLHVPKRDIEIKPLASSGPGFDRQKQVTIAFPEVSVGSKIYLRYRRRSTQAEVPGMFSRHFPLGWNEYLQKWTFQVEAETPLHYEVHVPGPDKQKYITAETAEQSLKLSLTEPFYRSIWEEEGAVMDPLAVIWIGVTTAKTWRDLPRATVSAYETAMAAPLPEKYEKILAAARGLSTDIEQINSVTSQLADQVRYVGDWRLVRGAYHPRSLEKIASSGYGDCKDFSVSAGSILKRLGFDVHAAWVARGRDWVVSPLKLAALAFNHAILFATKNGREYWIDPTNTSSFAQGIYSDIAGHPALVLTPDGATTIREVPKMSFERGTIDMRLKLELDGEGVNGSGEFSLLGHAAVSMTAAELSSTKKSLDYTFVNWLVSTANLESWEVGDYSLKSRVVQDIKSSIKYREQWRPITTSAGSGYLVPIPPYARFLRVRMGPTRVSSLRLEDPVIWRREYRFRGRDAIFAKDLACAGTSPWVDFSRELKRVSGEAVLADTIKVKASVVPNAELQTAAFSQFQTEIIRCMQEAVVVFK